MGSRDRIISASQINTFQTCPRKWWFERITRLKEPPKSHFVFGSVLHECAERFLAATENGRVPDPVPECYRGQEPGAPVDLYPEGWESIKERNGTTSAVTPNEAKQIRKVIDEAIKEGVLVREEGMQVERELRVPVVPGVMLLGYIDAFRHGEVPRITDHKTFSKGGARYLRQPKPEAPNYLGKDQQLLTYAAASSILDGHEGPVELAHNQFPKFPGRKPRTVTSEPIPEKVWRDHWEIVKKEALHMQRVAKIERWEDAPGPRVDDACGKYGGCPFSGICTRQESIDVYRERVAKEIEAADGKPRLNLRLEGPKKARKPGTTISMSIFDKARRGDTKAKAQKAAAKTDANPVTETPTAAAVAAPAASHGAPWASPTCKACKGSGFNSAGAPCPICAATAAKRGVPKPTDYVIESTDDGFIAVAKEESAERLSEMGAPLEWSSSDGADEAPAAPEQAPESEAAQEPAEEPQDEPAEEATDDAEQEPQSDDTPSEEPEQTKKGTKASGSKPPKSPGRRKVGVTLLIGCSQIRGTQRPTISSSEVLARFGAELAEAMGAESYWELDPFKRRERLAQKADYIADELSRHIVVHMGTLGNDDEGSLLRALMGLEEGIEQVVVA